MLLIDYLPEILQKIQEMAEICKAEQEEIDNIIAEIDKVEKRRYVTQTDMMGIERFEKLYGITDGKNKEMEDRRVAVLIKKMGSKMSLSGVKTLIKTIDENVELAADCEAAIFELQVEDEADNLLKLYETLDKVLPQDIYMYFTYDITNKTELSADMTDVDLGLVADWWYRQPKWTLNGAYNLDGSINLCRCKWEQIVELEET